MSNLDELRADYFLWLLHQRWVFLVFLGTFNTIFCLYYVYKTQIINPKHIRVHPLGTMNVKNVNMQDFMAIHLIVVEIFQSVMSKNNISRLIYRLCSNVDAIYFGVNNFLMLLLWDALRVKGNIIPLNSWSTVSVDKVVALHLLFSANATLTLLKWAQLTVPDNMMPTEVFSSQFSNSFIDSRSMLPKSDCEAHMVRLSFS